MEDSERFKDIEVRRMKLIGEFAKEKTKIIGI